MGCLKLTYRSENPTLKVVSNNLKISSNSCAGQYRFGFNGYERDNEVKGYGNHVDFGARGYDPRRGQFLTIDRLTAKFPNQSPYVFAANTPIQAIDADGNAAWVVIKTTSTLSGKTIQRMVFDKDLVNPGGVYFVHKWVNPNNNFVESQSSGVANYSEYSQQFPNFSQGIFEHKFSISKLLSSASIQGETNILFGEVGLEGEIPGLKLGGSFGVDGKLIGLTLNSQDKSGSIPVFGWQSSNKGEGQPLDLGGGIAYGAGISYRHKFDWVKGNFLDENKFEISGIATTMDVDGYSGKTNLSWGLGGKFALGFGLSGDIQLNIDMNKFTNALQPFSQFEKVELQYKNSGSETFNPSEY